MRTLAHTREDVKIEDLMPKKGSLRACKQNSLYDEDDEDSIPCFLCDRPNDVIYGYAPPPGWKRVQVIATGEIIGLLCRDAVEGIDRGCPRGAVCPGHPVLVTRP